MATVTETPKTRKMIDQAIALAREVAHVPAKGVWMSYDHDADVLYLSLEKPQHATNSLMRDDGILLRYRGKKLVGVTVLEASKR